MPFYKLTQGVKDNRQKKKNNGTFRFQEKGYQNEDTILTVLRTLKVQPGLFFTRLE